MYTQFKGLFLAIFGHYVAFINMKGHERPSKAVQTTAK